MENKHFKQAIALVNVSQKQIEEIELGYDLCLSKMEIDDNLLIVIKNFLENLRSALEYSAQGLSEKYGTCKDKSKISFPYAKKSVPKEQFIAKKYIEKRIPGLSGSRPDIVNFIQSMQHFSDKRAEWFPVFMSLTNTNKHIEFVPHEKFEGVEMSFGGSSIVASGFSGTGTFPKDAKIKSWDAFLIKGVDWPMTGIEFLKHCQAAIYGVVNQLEKM